MNHLPKRAKTLCNPSTFFRAAIIVTFYRRPTFCRRQSTSLPNRMRVSQSKNPCAMSSPTMTQVISKTQVISCCHGSIRKPLPNEFFSPLSYTICRYSPLLICPACRSTDSCAKKCLRWSHCTKKC